MNTVQAEKDNALKQSRAKKRQGGFSDFIVAHQSWIQYAGLESCGGYIGASRRTKEKDRVVESLLIKAGLTIDELVGWLTSTSGRHLMDEGDSLKGKAFELHAKRYLKDVRDDATIYNHPDHSGIYDSTLKLRFKLFPWKYDEDGMLREQP